MIELEVLKEWKTYTGNDDIDIYDYISSNINPEEVFLIGKYIYFPSIIEFRNGFFLESKISPSGFDRWFNQFNGNISNVEKIINHTHIYDLFDKFFDKNINDDIFGHLGEQIKLSWELYLKHKFPNILFTVEYEDSTDTYGPTITFYQKNLQ